jgi:hypothetical protein
MSKEIPDQDRARATPLAFKSLIRFGNVTYRIGRLRHGEYEVVRILDDVRIGTFGCFPELTVTSSSIHPAFILKIARAAARTARTSWIRRLAHALRGKRVSEVRPRVDEADSEERKAEDAKEREDGGKDAKEREDGGKDAKEREDGGKDAKERENGDNDEEEIVTLQKPEKED